MQESTQSSHFFARPAATDTGRKVVALFTFASKVKQGLTNKFEKDVVILQFIVAMVVSIKGPKETLVQVSSKSKRRQ